MPAGEGPLGELKSPPLPLPSPRDGHGLGLLLLLLLLLGGLFAYLPFSAPLLRLLRSRRSLSPLLLRGEVRSLDGERCFRLRRGLTLRLRRLWSGLRLGVRPRAGGLIRLRRAGGLRLSRPLALRSRSWSRGEYDRDRRRRRRRRGGEDKGLLGEGDRRRGDGVSERARIGLRERERERRVGPREREERSLEGVLPRAGGERERLGERYRGRWSTEDENFSFVGKVGIGRWLTAPPRLLQPLSLVLLSGLVSFPIPPLPLLPRPLPLPPPRSDLSARSRSRISSSRSLRSRSASARPSPSLARRISSFFSSTKLRGMPAGESCASINKSQRATMNAAVESVRNPVRLICIFLGSGVCSRHHQCGCKG